MAHKKSLTKKQKILRVVGLLISISLTLWFWSLVSEKSQARLVRSITRLIPTVGIATFIGTVVELRNWLRFMKLIINPLVSFARLPFLAGASMVTSLFSNKAAASIISGAYGEKEITRRSLISTAMCNSHFSYLSHSLRVFYPVVAAAGIPGLAYFGIQFSLGFLILFIVLLLHRAYYIDKSKLAEGESDVKREVPNWSKTVQRAGKRTLRIILRLLIITVPMYLLVLYMTQEGVFEKMNQLLPAQMAKLITAEMMTVAASMMGGLVNAATLAGEMLRNGEISAVQIVISMLLGSAMGNPVRTIRRNLPSAMGIYPPAEGFTIVALMQSARFVTTLFVCFLLLIFQWKSM